MLEFIQKKLRERMPDISNHKIDDPVPNDIMMECAHLIQELDDLSIEGADEASDERPLAPALNIPLEDDLEIGSIELNLLDGRVTDVAGDTSVPTVNEYALNTALKTEEDFYQEAVNFVRRLPRDSEASIEERRREYAARKMTEYQDKCIQEGVFGHNKINVSDASVPSTVTLNFGPLKGPGSPDYYVKLPVLFQVDKHKEICRKQLEAISIASDVDAFKTIKNTIHETCKNSTDYNYDSADTLWEHVTPKEIRVPVGPPDKYVVMVVFEADWTEKDLVYSCAFNMKGANKKTAEIKKATSALKGDFKTKKELIKEYAEEVEAARRAAYPNRFYQEAIDFGGSGTDTDLPPASGTDTSDVTVGGDPAPDTSTAQSTDNTTSTTPSVDASPAPDDNTNTNGGAVEVPVQTNDVSDQIADKVASETQDMNSDQAIDNDLENAGDTEDDWGAEPTFGDEGSSELDTNLDDSVDASADDTGSDDETVGDVDLPGEEDGGDMDMSNIENMSIEDLINQGSEKLKTLSISQLKSFLSGENTDPVVEEAFQEAFFLTSKNINKELDSELKRTLGILNETNESGTQILSKFKKLTKPLNRALVKASKMEKVYNEDERKTFAKLNKCLMDLNVVIGTGKDPNYAATIKRLVQAFVSQTQAAAKIIEAHNPAPKGQQTKGMTDVNAKVTGKKPKREV